MQKLHQTLEKATFDKNWSQLLQNSGENSKFADTRQLLNEVEGSTLSPNMNYTNSDVVTLWCPSELPNLKF